MQLCVQDTRQGGLLGTWLKKPEDTQALPGTPQPKAGVHTRTCPRFVCIYIYIYIYIRLRMHT